MSTIGKHARVWEYSQAYTLDSYASDEGHAWDRIACIAGEYSRGELTWADVKRLCDETRGEVESAYATRRAGTVVTFPCASCGSDTDADDVSQCLGCGDEVCTTCDVGRNICAACAPCAECADLIAHNDPRATFVYLTYVDGTEMAHRVCSDNCAANFRAANDEESGR